MKRSCNVIKMGNSVLAIIYYAVKWSKRVQQRSSKYTRILQEEGATVLNSVVPYIYNSQKGQPGRTITLEKISNRILQ